MRKPIQAGTAFVMFLATLIILAYVGVPMLVDRAMTSKNVPLTTDAGGRTAEPRPGDATGTHTGSGPSSVGESGTSARTLNGFTTFTSKADVVAYLDKAFEYAQGSYSMTMGRGFDDFNVSMPTIDVMESLPTMAMDGAGMGQVTSPTRVSSTNVQVAGIDEPDIVKTNGSEIFISGQGRYYDADPVPLRAMPVEWDSVESDLYYPRAYRSETSVVSAFPPQDMEILAPLERGGKLLIADDVLVVIEDRALVGYDISDPTAPEEVWELRLEDQTNYHQARLMGSTIYLVTQTYLDRYDPCPYVPLMRGTEKLTVACTDIYHPAPYVASEVTYTVAAINAHTGAIDRDISFVGSWNATVYMSDGALYVTYPLEGDLLAFMFGFVTENDDLFPRTLVARITTLKSYDISQSAKMMEFERALGEWERGLDADSRLRVENEIEDRMTDYFGRHKRELSRTTIVKINTKDLGVWATGEVPGTLLNQFSLDEHRGNLRVAVTVGEGWFGFIGRGESANDVYVLDSELRELGSVLDLGLTERVYAARFIGDVGYVVTFRETDPFYVLDLSDPRDPRMTGELKIPGYSSYLHPIDADTVVGVGKEGSRVKVSLFDVSDPASPTEADKYELSEYWTDVLNTHHAFLHDEKHEIFFMPGSKGGYIFSYTDNELVMVRAVSGIAAERALYLDDYLYVVGRDAIVVLDQEDWERVAEIELR